MKKNLLLAAGVLAVALNACKEEEGYTYIEPAAPDRNIVEAESVTDVDGNTYPCVTIGGQVWMAQNLASRTYASGSYIAGKKLSTATKMQGTPYITAETVNGAPATDYYSGNMSAEQKEACGLLYNFAAATGVTSDATKSAAKFHSPVQGICPDGYDMPVAEDFEELKAYLANQYGSQYNPARLLKSETGWYNDGNGCNTVGFNLLPSGWGSSDSIFARGFIAGLWTSSVQTKDAATLYYARHMSGFLDNGAYKKPIAQSVRCIKQQGSVMSFDFAADSIEILAPGEAVLEVGSVSPIHADYATLAPECTSPEVALSYVEEVDRYWKASVSAAGRYGITAPAANNEVEIIAYDPIEGIALDAEEHAMTSGSSFKLTATVSPATAKPAYSFTTEAVEGVATVSVATDGTVTATLDEKAAVNKGGLSVATFKVKVETSKDWSADGKTAYSAECLFLVRK